MQDVIFIIFFFFCAKHGWKLFLLQDKSANKLTLQHDILFVLGFYGPVNNEVMSSRSVKSGTVPGQALTF